MLAILQSAIWGENIKGTERKKQKKGKKLSNLDTFTFGLQYYNGNLQKSKIAERRRVSLQQPAERGITTDLLQKMFE